jgi:putative transposase
MRKTEFANGEYYHVFNRGVDKRDIFSDARDYKRFLLAMELLNDEEDGLMIEWRNYKNSNSSATLDDFLKPGFRKRSPLVEIIAHCLNPNHYHFILKQIDDKGVERFMHKLGTSHTKYFNIKQKRSGTLFQGRFRAVHIDSNEYLLYLSVYVNKNNLIHGYNRDDNWPYSSLPYYLGKKSDKLVNPDVILKQFESIEQYKDYLENNASHMREKKELEKYLIEE